tara:strand:+ start:506 stop:1486 length:981 start_codon:yes stop_codon:yes gene_type:complete
MGEENKYTIPKSVRKAVDQAGLPKPERDLLENLDNMVLKHMHSGIGGGRQTEAIPEFNSSPSEHIISARDLGRNASIVLGYDRESTKTTGYGGRGHTHAAAIDIVVGRMGPYAVEADNNGNKVKANIGFKVDSARIYISQKTDIDEYFGINEGKVGSPKGRSAIALKADSVRLVARKGVKIVTGVDTRESAGFRQLATDGIDLMAGNPEDETALQPLVKGDNLRQALSDLSEQIAKLRGVLYGFLKSQRDFNTDILNHQHNSPFMGIPTSQPFVLAAKGIRTIIEQVATSEKDINAHAATLTAWEQNYLNPLKTDTYINSNYNRTN